MVTSKYPSFVIQIFSFNCCSTNGIKNLTDSDSNRTNSSDYIKNFHDLCGCNIFYLKNSLLEQNDKPGT